MSRIRKEIANKISKHKKLEEERERMETFCIQSYQGGDTLEQWEAWVAKVKAMSLADLTKEYNKRDGDHFRDHGCYPEEGEEGHG